MIGLILMALQFFLWTSVGQTFVAQKASAWASNYLNAQVSIGKVNISFIKFVKLQEVYIADQHQDTLMYLGALDAGVNGIHWNDTAFTISLGKTRIDTPKFYLKKYPKDSVVNLRFFLNAFKSDKAPSKSQFLLDASEVEIISGMFIWDNSHKPNTPFGMDWNHIDLTDINAHMKELKVVNDSITGHFHYFQAHDKSGFQLDTLSGDVVFSSTTTQVHQMLIATPFSRIHGQVNYAYPNLHAYTEFIDSIYQQYHITQASVNFKDIAYFAPALEGLDYQMNVSGKVRGPVSDMRATELHIRYGQATMLKGRVNMRGLPDITNTAFYARFDTLQTSYNDLITVKTYPFTTKETLEIPPHLQHLGTVNFKGLFNGFYNDFVTYGEFHTPAGDVKTDIQLAPKENGSIAYSGQLITKNFDIGLVANQPELLGKTTFNLAIDGNNFDFERMDIDLKGKVDQLELLDYNYSNITVDGGVKDRAISGQLAVADSNIDFSFDGTISLNKAIPHYAFNADVKYLRPTQLHLADRDSSAVVSSKLLFNFHSNSIDHMVGRAELTDFHFKEGTNEVQLKRVDFIGLTDGKNKTLNLKSDNIELDITGEFYFNELLSSLKYQAYRWIPSFFSEVVPRPETVENFEMHLDASNYSGFSGIFIPQVTFKEDIKIDFWYNSEADSLVLETSCSQLNVFNFKAKDFSLQAQMHTDTFHLQTNAKKWVLADSSYIENFTTNTFLERDWVHAGMTWNNHHKNNNNSGAIQFDLNFKNTSNFDLSFTDSWININDSNWIIENDNQINIHDREWEFKNVSFSQNNKGFHLNGAISEDASKALEVTVDSFNLAFLNPLLSRINLELAGIIDGHTEVKDVYHHIQLASQNNFLGLYVNQTNLGNGYLKSKWDDQNAFFDVDISFDEPTFKPIVIQGKYYPLREKNELDLVASLDQFPIQIIEPFFADYIDDVAGKISGEATIHGSILAPEFNGTFNLHHAETKVIYLNEKLYLDDQEIFIRPDLIGADAVIVKDSKGRKAQINFSLFHDNFTNLNMDLAITSIDLFRAFNTTQKDNEYFYGNIVLSPGSTLGMETDYEGNLNLNATVKSGPGTEITIPFFDDDEVAKRDYIYFKDVADSTPTTLLITQTEKEEASINLDMALELTTDAEVQMIFDEFTADKIRATGNGVINVKLDPEGNFNLYGNYTIQEGNYLFTFSQVISKNFEIKPNSTITWNGDPYDGVADIEASYKIRTTLIDLGMVSAYDTNELKKRIPVEVVLSIQNKYMNPDLNFSFVLPSRYDEIESLLNSLDDGEKNKQVFGLLILNKFMPIVDNSISSSTGVIATNSTELLSNQLSNWLSTINDDVDIGVRYSPGDNVITSDEVEVALSTQLFNDRFLVETNFGISGTSNTTTTKSNNFVGEFTLSYKVNKKGNIVGKVFQRSNELNPALVNVAPYTQGVGIAYTEGFKTWDNLGCIIGNNFRKSGNKLDCEAEYYKEQEANQEKYLERVEKRVQKSREKQEKRKLKRQKKQARREEKNAVPAT